MAEQGAITEIEKRITAQGRVRSYLALPNYVRERLSTDRLLTATGINEIKSWILANQELVDPLSLQPRALIAEAKRLTVIGSSADDAKRGRSAIILGALLEICQESQRLGRPQDLDGRNREGVYVYVLRHALSKLPGPQWNDKLLVHTIVIKRRIVREVLSERKDAGRPPPLLRSEFYMLGLFLVDWSIDFLATDKSQVIEGETRYEESGNYTKPPAIKENYEALARERLEHGEERLWARLFSLANVSQASLERYDVMS